MSDKGKCGNCGPGYAKNPEYRITLKPAGKNVRVEVGDKVIVESENALLMLEQNHQAVCYFPQSEVRMEHFQRTDHVTHCPFKGDASYWSLTVAGRELENIMWSSETFIFAPTPHSVATLKPQLCAPRSEARAVKGPS